MTDLSKCIQYLIIVLIVGEINGANILAMFPSIWTSHYLFGREILINLASRGHNVTVAYNGRQHLPQINKNNYTEIIVKDDNGEVDMTLILKFSEVREKSTLELFTSMLYMGTSNVNMFLSNKDIQDLLKSEIQFDLLIGDFFLSDSLFGFAHYLKCPTVIIGPTGINQWLTGISGNPHNSAYNPSVFLPFIEEMTLLQRILNTLMCMFEKLTYNFFHIMYQETFYHKYFSTLQQENLPILKDIMQNVSLILLNSNPFLQYPNAFLPNIVEIGGAHINEETNSNLSKDIFDFIEESQNAVILIALGATLRTIDLPKEKLEALLNAINYLQGDVKVILKWEKLEMDNKPQNVLIKKWLPQQKILAHPKVKLLISTGGLMSYLEAIHYKKPILGIPIFPSHEVNLKRIENLGCGLKLDYEKLTTINLVEKIQEILRNPHYEQNLIKISKLFNSTNLNKPLDLSSYYIEQVLQSNGGLQFKSNVHNQLGFLQYEMIDVLVIILSGILIIIALPSIIICIILRKSNNQINNNNNINFFNSNSKKILKNNFSDRNNFKYDKKEI